MWLNRSDKILFFVIIMTVLCMGCDQKRDNIIEINEELFGTLDDNREVYLYTLTNENGIEVKITNFGGIITSLKTPDKNGNLDNIVLGFDNLQDYLDGHPYFGALLGRYAGRIEDGKFELEGNKYQLSTNLGEHHIHGGYQGFDKVLWNAKIVDDRRLRLTYLSVDGEEGYPGNLNVIVEYTLTKDDYLEIEYNATTDKATPINLSNHSYFNLTGDFSQTILDHKLKIYSRHYTPTNNELIPTGTIEPVNNTPLDFIEFSTIGANIEEVYGGYDHNYVLEDDYNNNKLQIAAELIDSTSGRTLTVLTTKPGIQLYTGNFLDGQQVSSDGIPFEKYAGVCLETRYFPNSPNEANFPSTILYPDDIYQSTTVFSFSTMND